MGPLVDTSVLIDYFDGRDTDAVVALDHLLEDGVAPSTAPIIVQEFLQGFVTPRDLARAGEYLALFDRLEPPDYELHESAARLFRSLRRKGVTTSTADCLIVAMAQSIGVALLTGDVLQRRVAVDAGVDLWPS